MTGSGPGRLAHDLNNLLMAIVGSWDLLERGALETGDAVRAIRAAAESAAHLAETGASGFRPPPTTDPQSGAPGRAVRA